MALSLLKIFGITVVLAISVQLVTGQSSNSIEKSSISNSTELSSSSKSNFKLKIVGGFPAERASTRFIASLRLTIEEFEKFGAGHKCGASLISENVLLSAAHCFLVPNSESLDEELRDPCDWTIVLGSYNRFTQETTTVIRSVRGITVHVDYDGDTKENDIALLFLNESVPLTQGVVEIVELNDKELEIGTQCQASGWGRVEYNGALADDLQSVNISLIDVNICNDTDSYGGEVYEGMLCVGNLYGDKDSCQGDSGGPLICDNVLAGVVSWGVGCAFPKYPGIYTDVNYFREWIQNSVDAGPDVLAKCAPSIDPSTESPVFPTTTTTTSNSTSNSTEPSEESSNSTTIAPSSSPSSSSTEASSGSSSTEPSASPSSSSTEEASNSTVTEPSSSPSSSSTEEASNSTVTEPSLSSSSSSSSSSIETSSSSSSSSTVSPSPSSTATSSIRPSSSTTLRPSSSTQSSSLSSTTTFTRSTTEEPTTVLISGANELSTYKKWTASIIIIYLWKTFNQINF